MPCSPDLPHRHSIRLHRYDYSQAGAYFVTVCVFNRACLLGEIAGDAMRLSAAGDLVAHAWDDLPQRFPSVELDAFVVMPNHVHGIIVLTDAPLSAAPASVGAEQALPDKSIILPANHDSAVKKGTPRSAPTLLMLA